MTTFLPKGFAQWMAGSVASTSGFFTNQSFVLGNCCLHLVFFKRLSNLVIVWAARSASGPQSQNSRRQCATSSTPRLGSGSGVSFPQTSRPTWLFYRRHRYHTIVPVVSPPCIFQHR